MLLVFPFGACGGGGDDSGTPRAENEAVCGDGIVDTSEACDDNNKISGDGCSSTCIQENSCDTALDYYLVAESAGEDAAQINADLKERSNDLEGCGGTGREVVYSYTAPSKGILFLHLVAADPLMLSVQSACSNAAQSYACVDAGDTSEITVAADQTITLVVDSPPSVTGTGAFTLNATFLPLLVNGASCDLEGDRNRCDTNLRCAQNPNEQPKCTSNSAPSLTTATVFRTGREGNDLYISVSGADAEGDVTSIVMQGMEANGTEKNNGTFSLRETMVQAGPFTKTFVGYNYFKSFPNVTKFNVAVKDSGGLSSETLSNQSAVYSLHISRNNSCDPFELINVCDTGLRCTGQSPVCVDGHAPILSEVGFFDADSTRGKRIVVRGADTDRDVVSARIDFIGATVNGGAFVNVPVQHAANTTELLFQVNASSLVDVTGVSVRLKDATGVMSNLLTRNLMNFPEPLNSGASCDVGRRFNVCGSNLTCISDHCASGSAPTITKAAYLRQPEGDFVLLEGHDTEKDIATVKFEFFDGASGILDSPNGNKVGDPGYLVYSVAGREEGDGNFFIPFNVSALSFAATKIVITLTDTSGLNVARTVTLAPLEIVETGDACSDHGFDQCEAGTRCSSAHVCVPVDDLRKAACGSAITDLSEPLGTQGPSLWDPPASCTGARLIGGAPEVVATFTLGTARNVTISTDNDGTTFDTILYVLRLDANACNGELLPAAVACNDDVTPRRNFTSRLELNALAAGTYLVVVDAYDELGGNVKLTIDGIP